MSALGSFNNWSQQLEMKKDQSGNFILPLELDPTIHTFRFLINDSDLAIDENMKTTISENDQMKMNKINAKKLNKNLLTTNISKNSGSVYSWGCNEDSQLGFIEKSKFINNPIRVDPLMNRKVISIATGESHVCALTNRGYLYSWGENIFGELGQSHKTAVLSPRIIDGFSGISNVFCGTNHTFFIHKNQVYGFGRNDNGQLGLGHKQQVFSPTHIQALDEHRISMIAAGKSHTLFASDADKLFSCGFGKMGQLGFGVVVEESKPKMIKFFKGTRIKKISCGENHTLVLTFSGQVYGFGSAIHGEFGFSSKKNLHAPKKLEFFQNIKVIDISCFGNHSLIMTEKEVYFLGEIYGYKEIFTRKIEEFSGKKLVSIKSGMNINGILTLNDQTGLQELSVIKTVPKQMKQENQGIDGIEVDAVSNEKCGSIKQICCGEQFVVILNEESEIFFLGKSENGENGFGELRKETQTPEKITFFNPIKIAKISYGFYHSLFLTDEGHVYSSGSNEHGQLGIGDETSKTTFPHLIESLLGRKIVEISAGRTHSMVLSEKGKVYVFGSGICLGLKNIQKAFFPLQVVEGLENEVIVDISVGHSHSCVINQHGNLFTWGVGQFGILGHGNTNDYNFPKKVESIEDLCVISVDSGNCHTAVLTKDGVVFIMGGGWSAEKDVKDDLLEPQLIQSLLAHRVVQVSCGGFHTLALTDTGNVFSWGLNNKGQLGHGDYENDSKPKLIQKLKNNQIKSVSAGDFHSLVLSENGEIFSWGSCDYGQLGLGRKNDEISPQLITELQERKVFFISSGQSFSGCITNSVI
eukprot:Anaeramoba_ignava/c20794_g3_i2.p1 GENE.c20794_g3_i2~~c20794_g3_i2.p1  ORF type:complete len:859 (-),score=337.64 c20794_g3_i2:45-2471(-)